MLSWTIFLASQAFANGSIGVGTASVPISDGIEASNLNGQVKRSGTQIVHTNDGRGLIEISDVNASELAALQESDRVVSARFGGVDGYEYTPDFKDMKNSNYWIVCRNGSCKKLEPLSNDVLVSELLGTLTQTK